MTETFTEPQPPAEPAPAPEPHMGRPTYPPEAWAKARQFYVSGLPASSICEQLGMSESGLRQRARREGWRRADQPWIPPIDDGAELEARHDGVIDRIELLDLADVAFTRMKRAVLRGSAAEALRWKQVAEMLWAEHEQAERWGEQADAERDALLERTRECAEAAAGNGDRPSA